MHLQEPCILNSLANLFDCFACRVELFHHHVNGIPYSLKERGLQRALPVDRTLSRIDVGKQNLLLFLYMHDHLPRDFAEEFLNVFNLVMFFSMLFSDPRQQCAETRDHVPNIPVAFFLRGISLVRSDRSDCSIFSTRPNRSRNVER